MASFGNIFVNTCVIMPFHLPDCAAIFGRRRLGEDLAETYIHTPGSLLFPGYTHLALYFNYCSDCLHFKMNGKWDEGSPSSIALLCTFILLGQRIHSHSLFSIRMIFFEFFCSWSEQFNSHSITLFSAQHSSSCHGEWHSNFQLYVCRDVYNKLVDR